MSWKIRGAGSITRGSAIVKGLVVRSCKAKVMRDASLVPPKSYLRHVLAGQVSWQLNRTRPAREISVSHYFCFAAPYAGLGFASLTHGSRRPSCSCKVLQSCTISVENRRLMHSSHTERLEIGSLISSPIGFSFHERYGSRGVVRSGDFTSSHHVPCGQIACMQQAKHIS